MPFTAEVNTLYKWSHVTSESSTEGNLPSPRLGTGPLWATMKDILDWTQGKKEKERRWV